MKICPVGVELFHAGRQTRQTDGQMERETDMTKLEVAFCNFANELKTFLLSDSSVWT